MLLVKAYCAYLTRAYETWRPEDYEARFYTRMLKGSRDGLNTKYCWRPKIRGTGNVKFLNSEEGIAEVREHFAQWAARELKVFGKVSLFPVPNSNATPNMVGSYGTRDIAEMIAAEFGSGAEVIDKLRFRKPMQPSSKGGTRDRLLIAREMMLPSGSKPTGRPVLVDDVLTSGAHLLASRTVLAGRNITVERAIVCGRAIDHQLPDPFNVPDEDIDDDAFFGLAG